ncbi:helix-turn-helix domain-containing protein [Bosea sp. Root483D1]|uniref:helix-turn-helix domain-containing protein n=1 Tax=Bosea sp. Root483D1 TaxID=1736544 RepID=UPI0009E82CE5|nr:helix-turn-helix transcriptional regulator [Bosea sp. Root483D1]
MKRISIVQCRAARGLLDWSQTELASRANLSESTIRDFEKNRRIPGPNNLAAVRHALEQAGVQFVDDGLYTGTGGPGVRLLENVPQDATTPLSQASIDAGGVEARSQAASAADRAMVGMDATSAQKADRRQRLTDEPEVVRKARSKKTDDA